MPSQKVLETDEIPTIDLDLNGTPIIHKLDGVRYDVPLHYYIEKIEACRFQRREPGGTDLLLDVLLVDFDRFDVFGGDVHLPAPVAWLDSHDVLPAAFSLRCSD